MNLQDRINIMTELGNYISSNNEHWMAAKIKAEQQNPWFSQQFITLSINNIVAEFLQKDKLQNWVHHYHIDDNIEPRLIGLVMAGNIPLVGFHDFLCIFISGHRQKIKPSSKDDVLIREIITYLNDKYPGTIETISIAEQLKGCDAYIATGSNNSSRYFEQYFAKYPNIIRKNRTSISILNGDESPAELQKLAADIHLFYGLGCRNVTKIYLPDGYDFLPLLAAFKNYEYLIENHRYKNNYDYQLSILLLNRQYYMTNGTTLLVENPSPNSPISVLHYSYYKPGEKVPVEDKDELQCVSGKGFTPHGTLQTPGLFHYADGIDTMAFLLLI